VSLVGGATKKKKVAGYLQRKEIRGVRKTRTFLNFKKQKEVESHRNTRAGVPNERITRGEEVLRGICGGKPRDRRNKKKKSRATDALV